MFVAATAQLEAGRGAGWHRGAQLAVTWRGERLPVICVGEASVGVPMTGDVLLPWFSCTKLLTAIAVLQQVERRAIDLDDPIARHVPEFAAGGKESVTVRHALTHTGGFRSAIDQLPSGAPVDWPAMVRAICAAPLEPGWIPGQRAAYHPRSGFQILAELLQRITGVDFADHVTASVIEPLGMVDGWVAMPSPRQAAYGDRMGVMDDTTVPSAPRRREDLARPGAFATPDGASGAVGPARDLVRIPEMVLGRGSLDDAVVLEAATLQDLVAPHRRGVLDETFGAVIDWGLGIMLNSWRYEQRPAPYGYGEQASDRAVGHGGVQSSVTFADPEHALAVALICNGMPGEAANHRRTQPVLTALYDDLGLTRK